MPILSRFELEPPASRLRWQVVELVVAGVLAVVGGVYFWAVGTAWTPMTTALALVPPWVAVLAGLWLVPGVLAGLVVRRPGAAVFTELTAAVIEALLGDQFGFSSVYYGLLQGLGAELVLAAVAYRRFGPLVALLAGAGAGVAVGVLDVITYYPTLGAGTKGGYVLLAVLSGAVVAGLGSWLLTNALRAAGALTALASGRSRELI